MSDQEPDPKTQTHDAIEADAMGEKPDLGRTPDGMRDALDRALSGTDSGSDTRAGSLQGGAASGSVCTDFSGREAFGIDLAEA